MENELSSLETHYVCAELASLAGYRVEKIYQWGRDDIIMRLFSREGKKNLRMKIPGLIYLTERDYKGPAAPPGFCGFLRKYLTSAAVRGVEQKGFDRIAMIGFDSNKHGKMTLIVELFKPGNVILCKESEGKLVVMQPLERQEFKDRNIMTKKDYVFPPSQADLKAMDAEELAGMLISSDKQPVKALAIEFGLGGKYAEEVMARSKLDKGLKKEELTAKQAKALAQAAKGMIEEAPAPFIASGKAYPIRLDTVQGADREFKTFNEAIDSVIELHQVKVEQRESKKEQDKSQAIIDAQASRITQLEKEIDESQRTGEFIYEHYADFKRLLDTVKEMRAQKKSYKEIESELKKNKRFKSLDEKEKTIVLEF